MAVTSIKIAPGYGVSRLTKGNWQLAERHGPPVERARAVEGMRRFVEAGITNFDCADHYVGVEELIGEFRRAYPALASQLSIQTKLVPRHPSQRYRAHRRPGPGPPGTGHARPRAVPLVGLVHPWTC